MSNREDEMKAWRQNPNESIMEYVQLKLRMCQGLRLPFESTKDYVLRGLYSKTMALYATGRNHYDENELLADLLSLERMNALYDASERDRSSNAKQPSAGVTDPPV